MQLICLAASTANPRCRAVLLQPSGEEFDAADNPARQSVSLWWAQNANSVLAWLSSSAVGLTTAEADRRLAVEGPNQTHERPSITRAGIVLNQMRSPLLSGPARCRDAGCSCRSHCSR